MSYTFRLLALKYLLVRFSLLQLPEIRDFLIFIVLMGHYETFD